MKNRYLISRLLQIHSTPRGRMILLSGARQTGKTTLVKKVFPEYPYISVEDPVVRVELGRYSAQEWYKRFPFAIIDEIQKMPSLCETLQTVYDLYPDARYILSGSSRVLLLRAVAETMAGRCALLELDPLIIPEMAAEGWDNPIRSSPLIRFLETLNREVLETGTPLLDIQKGTRLLFDAYCMYGAMPGIIGRDYSDDDRVAWLNDYHQTFLQRDLADLSQLHHLEPFVRAQQAIAAQTANCINYADLARTCGTSPDTARRFLRYLEISYHVQLLPAFFNNPSKRLVKAPKVHFIDPGVVRSITRNWGELDGSLFETCVVAEILKQCRVSGHDIKGNFYHIRTSDGREVDLLIGHENGFIGIEVKKSMQAGNADFRHLRGIEEILPKPLIAGFVLSNDPTIRAFGKNLYALPAWWFLG
jgi:predicted AAA+ superfamily ATPase